MLFALLRPGKLISLILLAAIVGGGWWGWNRLHRSEAASESAARAEVSRSSGGAAGVPKPGVYRFESRGDERIGVGPLTLGRQLPTRALVVVTPRGRALREITTRYSKDHAESWRTESDSAGVKGVYRTLEIGTIGYTKKVTGRVVPPVLLWPRKPKEGQRWEGQYTVAGIVFRRSSTVVGRSSIDIAGHSVKVFEIRTTETVTGTLHGDEDIRQWWAPSLGLPVRVEWHRNLDGVIVNIVSDTLTLENVEPLR